MSTFKELQEHNVKKFFAELTHTLDKVSEKYGSDPHPYMLLYIAITKDENNHFNTVLKESRNFSTNIRDEGPSGTVVASLMLHSIAQALAEDSVQSVKQTMEADGETDVDEGRVRSVACKVLLEATSLMATMMGTSSVVTRDVDTLSQKTDGPVQ